MSYQSEFLRRLFEIVENRLEELSNGVMSGAPEDYAKYKYLCGQITALKHVGVWARQVVDELNGE